MFDDRIFFGPSDRVIVIEDRLPKRIGWVGFWELDSPLPSDYYRILFPLRCNIHVFRSWRGFHLVSFKVRTLEERERWIEVCKQLGDTDYRVLKDNTLRVSVKHGERPLYSFTIQTVRYEYGLSSFHLRVYRPLFGLAYPRIRAMGQTVKTYGHWSQYRGDPSGVIDIARERGEK